MANSIQLKRSSVSGRMPDTANVLVGEPVVNLADQIIYTKDGSGSIIIIGAGTTSNITEGTNLYFSNARARDAFTAGNGITISNGVISSDAENNLLPLLSSYEFTASAGQTSFTGYDDNNQFLTASSTDGFTDVYLNGVRLIKTSDYTSNTTHVVLTDPADENDSVSIYSTVLHSPAFTWDTFTGDGTTTAFTMSKIPTSKASIIVTFDGIKQHTSEYSIDDFLLTFSAAPYNAANIEVIHIGGSDGLTVSKVNGVSGNVNINTGNIPEYQNLYFTNARVYSNVIELGYTTISNVATIINNLTTDDIEENSNQYFTNARVYSNVLNLNYATVTYVTNELANLVNSAPSTLDTLNELAAALGNDNNFATSTATLIGNSFDKANTAVLAGTSAFGQANTATTNAATATTYATSAFGQANTATTFATSAFGQANTATTFATSAFGQANTATTFATSAFAAANVKVATVAGVTNTSISNAALLAGLLTVDGSGSGLDADLLDGQSSAYYAAASSLSSYLPLSGGTVTGTLLTTPASVALQSLNDGVIGFGDPNHTSGWGVAQGLAARSGDVIWALGSNGSTGGNDTLYLGIGSISGSSFSTALSFTQNRNATFQVDARAPIFYDSNDTGYYLDPASTTNVNTLFTNSIFLERNEAAGRGISWYSSSYTSWCTYMSPASAGGSGPTSNITAPSGTYVTSWALRNFIENASGYGWTWESGSATGQPSVVAEIRSSDGLARFNGGTYSPNFYDSNDTGYYVDPNSTSRLGNIDVASRTLSSTYYDAAIEVREYNYGGAQSDSDAYQPRIGFHWGGRVASSIAMNSSGWLMIRNNPGSGYESFIASNIYATGVVSSYYSDDRLKTKVGIINNAIDRVKSIETFLYTNNDIALKNGFTGTEIQVGVSAQSVEKVLPEVVKHAPFDMQSINGEIVSKSGEWYKTVQYDRIVPLLIEAIKEQQKMIDELKNIVKGQYDN